MALITTGNWEAGDDLRIIEALKLPFGSYTLQCTQDCCNQLEVMSAEAVLNVRALLARYEAAETLQINADLADTEGKTLVKADVLEWEKDPGTTPSGPEQEMMRARQDLAQYFAFCSCMGSLAGGSSYATSLVRS